MISESGVTWLDTITIITSLLLSVAAIYGMQQIRLLKHDIFVRTDRAAKEKAIEAATKYLSTYVDLSSEWYRYRIREGIPSFEGKILEFDFRELSPNQVELAQKRMKNAEWLPSMNCLQAVASTFVTGVADESTGFDIIGRTFCSSVEANYDILCMCRQDVACNYFQSIVDLYRLWSNKLSKAELNMLRQNLDSQLDGLNK